MLKIPRNEKGISLVELLAVFVISGIVIMLIIAIFIFTQKQFQTQSEDAHHLTDITIAMKEITKDIRAYELNIPASPEKTQDEIVFIDGSNYKTYALDEEILLKNASPYIYDVKKFEVKFDENDHDIITINIESVTGQQLETTLMVR